MTSIASCERASPAAAAAITSRRSPDRPDTPRRPLRRSSWSSISAGVIPSTRAIHVRSPGSTEPARVAMTSPSRGVKPIVVSTEMPPVIAASDAPAPRWQVTRRSDSTGRSSSSAARRLAYRWLRPWKPYLRSPWRRRPFPRDGVGRGRVGDRRVERGVDADDESASREAPRRVRASASIASALCSGARSASAESRDSNASSTRAGARMTVAAVDEPHGCRLDRRCLGDETSERLDVERPVGGVFVRDQCPVVLVDDGELDAARPRVDGEHVHEHARPTSATPRSPADRCRVHGCRRVARWIRCVYSSMSRPPMLACLGRALQRPDREVVPTDSVVDQELERRLGGALLDVAADVEPARGRSVVHELVNRGGVAVEEEDDGPVLGEQPGELLGAQTVRMLVGGSSESRSTTFTTRVLSAGQILAEQLHRGERLDRGDRARRRRTRRRARRARRCLPTPTPMRRPHSGAGPRRWSATAAAAASTRRPG